MSISSTEARPLDPPGGTGRSDRWFLSRAPIGSALLHLCVPVAAGEAVTAVYNIVNAGFIGSLHDTDLLAALTFGLPLLALTMAVGGVFGSGGAATIARLLGRSEQHPEELERIKHVSAFAAWGSAAGGAVVGVAGLLLLHPIVAILGAGAVATASTALYVAVLFACTPVMALTFCLDQLVRAQGAARQAMTGLILSTVANVGFDVLFILVLDWGVAGAALSMGAANVVGAVYYVRFLQRHGDGIDLAPRWLTLSGTVVGPVLSIGSAALLQAGFLALVSLLLNHLAVAYGAAPLAGFGVAMRIVQLPEFLIMGLTTGILPLLAYSYGSGDGARMRSGLRGAAIATAAIVLLCSGTIALFRDHVFALFSADPSVIAVGTVILTAQLVATVFNGFTGLLNACFQAAGRALPTVLLSIGPAVLFVPFAVLGDLWIGLPAVIWAMTAAEVLVFALGLALFAGLRRSMTAGLADGSEARAEQALAAVEADDH